MIHVTFQQIILLIQHELLEYVFLTTLAWTKKKLNIVSERSQFCKWEAISLSPVKDVLAQDRIRNCSLLARSESSCLLDKTHTIYGILNKYPLLKAAHDKIIYYLIGLHATEAKVSSSIYSTSRYKKQLGSAKLNLCLCKVDNINHIFRHHFSKEFLKAMMKYKRGRYCFSSQLKHNWSESLMFQIESIMYQNS